MNQQRMNTGRNKWLAALMGLVMPGLGQIYNGELIKGVSFFVILQVIHVVGLRWTVLLPDRMLLAGLVCTIAAVLALYAAAILDCYRKAARTEIAYQPTSYNRWYFYLAVWLLGWVLVSGAVFGYVQDNVIAAYKVATGSMEPAIRAGDRVLADKTAYRRMSPRKDDIVIFVYPDDRSKMFVKRIEALPGQSVTGIDGIMKMVPHGFVYVTGDNRGNSYDSRNFGFVPMSDLVGKVRQVYFSSGPDGIHWDRIGFVVGPK